MCKFIYYVEGQADEKIFTLSSISDFVTVLRAISQTDASDAGCLTPEIIITETNMIIG